MKKILVFKMPDDEVEFNWANNGYKYYSVLCELDNELRSKLKYGNEFTSADDALEYIRNLLHQELIDNNITIHD